MKKALVFSCLIFYSSTLLAQQKTRIDNIKALTDSIEAIVKSQHTPGLMVGITTKDSVLFSGGFGYADLSTRRAVNGETLFRMGSITKMFVSLAILKLIEERKLSLQDELKKVAPEVPFQNKWEATHPVRIVHLLEHTAGFDDMQLNRMCSQDTIEYTGRKAMLLQQPSLTCRWKPGERFAYSNPDYIVLGYIIEKITGTYYNEYITTQLLHPLAMKASNFNLRSKFPDKDVKEYVVHDGQIKAVPSVTVLMPAAGTLWSSSDDMVKFLQFFLKRGDSLYTVKSLAEMETTHSSLAAEAGLRAGYGLGNTNLFIYQKYPWQGHGGWMGSCFSTCAYNRELGVGFVCSSNGNQSNGAIERLIMDYLEQHYPDKKTDTVSLDLAAIAPFIGQYRFENPRIEISGFKDRLLNAPKVYVEEGKLYAAFMPGGKIKLIQTAPFTFVKEDANTATVVFTKDAAGKNVMVMDGAYFEQTAYWRIAFSTWLAAISIFLALVAVITGIVSLIAYIAGKLPRKQLPLRVVPMVAVGLLVWAVMSLLQVQTESYLLSELVYPGMRSIVIFLGTLLFGVFSLLHLVLVIRQFKKMRNPWFYAYWLITTLSLSYISFVLLQNGWIGLRTWAM